MMKLFLFSFNFMFIQRETNIHKDSATGHYNGLYKILQHIHTETEILASFSWWAANWGNSFAGKKRF